MDKRDKKIRQLEDERNRLMTENQELKYIINDIQSVNDIMREDIEKECAAECGCIVIEGSRTSAAYQDLVGILLANNYSVEVIPMDERRIRYRKKYQYEKLRSGNNCRCEPGW